MRYVHFCFLLLLISEVVQAESPYKPMEGSYAIYGEDRDAEILFGIQGDSAKAMYDAISREPSGGHCGDIYEFTKSLGEVECHHNTQKQVYYCNFGFSLNTGEYLDPPRC